MMKTFIEYLAEQKYWGECAAGGIIVAYNTKRILFLKRAGSEDSEQGQWEMTLGGKKDPEDIDALATLNREDYEEIGLIPGLIKSDLIEIFDDTGDDHKKFRYHVYYRLVESEFKPTLSDEHDDYMWVDINDPLDLPQPLHFGAQRLLKNQRVIDLTKETTWV